MRFVVMGCVEEGWVAFLWFLVAGSLLLHTVNEVGGAVCYEPVDICKNK